MCTFARAVAASLALLALLAGAALAAPPSPGDGPRQIVVAFANQPEALPATAGSTGTRYSGGGYAVAQSAQRQARRVASEYSLHEVASWPIQVLSMDCVVFEITNGRSTAEVLAALAHDPRVALAQPLQEFHTLTDAPTASPAPGTPGGPTAPTAAAASASSATTTASAPASASYNDPLYDLQTNLATLGIARAHERTQGEGVHIALIDTAVDTNHPDLRGRIAHAQSYVTSQASSPGASLRHGTAVAGVIAAVANNHIGIVGIAPLAQLEVFAGCWQLAPGSDAAACNTYTLARALAAALASGAPLVNLSLAGPADPLLEALVKAGLKRGVTFVGAAAGADAPFPTAIPGVITAGGSDPATPRGALAAPAQHVLTLRPGGEYDFESGSSVAAAEVTGVIALLMAASPSPLTPAAIASLLGAGERSTPEAPTLDVNAALARLEAGEGGGFASRAAH
jgi:subtilisin family serine protease